MAWVMKSTRQPRGFEITIGALSVAFIALMGRGNPVYLHLKTLAGSQAFECEDISAAYKKLHELLNSPPTIEI